MIPIDSLATVMFLISALFLTVPIAAFSLFVLIADRLWFMAIFFVLGASVSIMIVADVLKIINREWGC